MPGRSPGVGWSHSLDPLAVPGDVKPPAPHWPMRHENLLASFIFLIHPSQFLLFMKWIDQTREKLGNPSDLELLQRLSTE